MTNHEVPDLKARNIALDPSRSFIVQAPAGSGKTSLLVARYLNLLTNVNNPEEILAITFTRKAACEMRDRIVKILSTANEPFAPQNEHQKLIQKLAQAALKQDQLKKWNILQNPNRLRIQTIDAFCYYLVNQAPIFTEITLEAKISTQEINFYYAEAARAVLKSIDEPLYKKPLENLLLHLGNDWEKAENLFITILRSREQWLPHIIGLNNSQKIRSKMEEALLSIAEENIKQAIKYFPKELNNEFLELIRFAQNNLEEAESFLNNINLKEKLFSTELISWQGLASFLLTKDFSWRKQITKGIGFPASTSKKNPIEKKLCKVMKKRMQEILTKLENHENFRLSLENILLTPSPKYQDYQWELIESLLELLPLLAAQLKVIFDENNTADHAEISLAADRALGIQNIPSELALNLDYRLEHILIDEFQDTSIAHYRLIEKLITNWQPNDGRTIFVVGDPMQSIYRFREAEVGLFLKVQSEGIGDIKLESIILTTNFRSAKNIIKWVNHNFTKILPQTAEIDFGAVPFKSSTSNLKINDAAVNIKLLKNTDLQTEALLAINTINNIIQKNPDDNIAILVKARPHLKEIIDELRKQNLEYQAFELETLQNNLVIRDLHSLTKALFDLNDRIAWIAILRAPWCGLTLNDLYKIAHENHETIWQTINIYKKLDLSEDGNSRAEKFIGILSPIITLRERLAWSELIEKTWLMLGGPATLKNKEELEHAELYFELLDNSLNMDILNQKLQTLYTPATNSKTKIQIMTIHKAKGLEFDHVIIPGINRAVRADENKLLLWFERPRSCRGSDLILAPITTRGKAHDHVYQYLKIVEQKKSFYENGRLLYVAITRAKKSATLLGLVPSAGLDSVLGIKGSFLEQLRPCFSEEWVAELPRKSIKNNAELIYNFKLSRLKLNWQSPITINLPTTKHSSNLEILDNQSSIIGTIIHKILKKISESNLDLWTSEYINSQHPYWLKLLKQSGYLNLDKGLKLLTTTIQNSLKDPKGRWILDQHQSAQSEFAITFNNRGKFEHYIIDRTFIDENGDRWIIDYKNSMPNQENLIEFLIKEINKYTPQLQKYVEAIQALESKEKIKIGLYFPLINKWTEIKTSIFH